MKKILIIIVFLTSAICQQAQTTVYQNSYVKIISGNLQGSPGLFVQSTQPGIFKVNWECGTQYGSAATAGNPTRLTWGVPSGNFVFKLWKYCPPNSTSNVQWKLLGLYSFNL